MSDKPIIITAPRQGIGPSPHTGFGDVRDLDIFAVPGVVKLNNTLTKESESVIDDLVLWIVKNPASPANLYALALDGAVYTSSNSGDTWTAVAGETAGGVGQGCIVWKDYLIVARATKIDTYGPLSGSPTWTNDWQTIDTDGAWHPMIVSKLDGKVYGGAGRYIFTIEELSGQNFAPGTSTTYTFTAQALDLPEDYKVKCLAELGNNLMIGTWQGTSIYDLKIADIFPWDGTSSTYGEPIQLNENGVNALLTIGSYLYILAGVEGNIYKSNGRDAVLIGKIPLSIADTSGGKYLEFFPGAIMNFKGRLFFGLSVGGTGNISGMGVWSLQETSQGNILMLEHTISTSSDGTDEVLKIGALSGITRDQMVVGWRDATTYGIDRTATTTYGTAGNYVAYFDSPFYSVGFNADKRMFSKLEIQLAKPLAANEGVRVAYRKDINASFTTIGTYDFTGLGAVKTHIATAGIAATEFVQIRVLLTGTTTTPHFKSLILT